MMCLIIQYRKCPNLETNLCHNKICLNEQYYLYSYSKTETLINFIVVTTLSWSYSLGQNR